jgi:CHASE3 domain sensor protein
MKLNYILISGFLVIILVVGVVGIIGFNASEQIAQSYRGLSEEFQEDVQAAIKVQSYAKRAEGHLMLYLTLGDEVDKEKFPERHASLEEQVEILENVVTTHGGQEQVKILKLASDDLLKFGNQLIEVYEANPEVFNFKDNEELIRDFHDVASAARKAGVEIAKKKTINAAAEAASYAKRTEGHLMLYLTLGDEVDKEKFPKRHASLQDQIEILDLAIKTQQQQQQLERLKLASDDLLKFGNQLIEVYEANPEVFNFKDNEELIRDFHDVASAARKAGVEITEIQIELEGSDVKEARKDAVSIQRNILIALIVSILFSISLGIYISRKIGDPITKLTQAVDEISKGNFKVDIEKSGSIDEINTLSDSLDRVMTTMKLAVDEKGPIEIKVEKKVGVDSLVKKGLVKPKEEKKNET